MVINADYTIEVLACQVFCIKKDCRCMTKLECIATARYWNAPGGASITVITHLITN